MADFAVILKAVDEQLGTAGLIRFTEQARSMAEDSLSADPFLAALEEGQFNFKGRAAELLVKARPDSDNWRPPRDWPKEARAVTTLLKRNAPAMRKAGWIVESGEDANHFTIWIVAHPEKVGKGSPSDPFDPPDSETTDHTDHTENEYGQSQGELVDLEPSAPPQCRTCGAELWAPDSQQRGVCTKCFRQAEARAS